MKSAVVLLCVLSLTLGQECQVDSDYDGAFDFEDFHSLAEMQDYLSFLSGKYRLRTESIGTSSEGRDLTLVKLCSGACGDRNGMWVDALVFPNEWSSAAAAMFLAQEIAANADYEDARSEVDWYILVAANPDGYEFTRDPSGDRQWIKTRSPNNADDSGNCPGTNLNRNFAFQWNITAATSSQDPCSQYYIGDYGFSESESRAMADYVLKLMSEDLDGRVVFYSSLHSPGDGAKILLPFGFAASEVSGPLRSLAESGAAAIAAETGREYDIAQLFETGPYSGLSSDWVAGSAFVDYVFEIIMWGSQPEGQEDQASDICDASREVLAFHLAAADYVAANTRLHDGAGSSAPSVALLAAAGVAIFFNRQ